MPASTTTVEYTRVRLEQSGSDTSDIVCDDVRVLSGRTFGIFATVDWLRLLKPGEEKTVIDGDKTYVFRRVAFPSMSPAISR